MAKGTPNAGINGTLANGLVAHYSFNDGSLADLSGNGYNLTRVGTVNNTVDKDGKINQAKENTTSSYLTSKPKSLTGGTDNAVSMWVYIPDLKHAGTVFSMWGNDTSGGPTILIAQKNDSISVYTSGAYSSYIKITAGWHNIIYNKNKLYIDKQLKTIHNTFTIGVVLNLFMGYSEGLVCKLDEVRVYNRLLTGDRTVIGETATGEIAEIFDMGVNYEATPLTFSTINTSNITSSSVDLNINCNEDATAYYKIYNRGATAPTPEELKTTHDGTITLTANNLITKSITGLTSLKDYDLYVVAEDVVGNLQATPSLLQFNASLGKVAIPTTDSPSGTYENGKIVTLNCATPGAEIRFTVDGSEPTEISQLYLTPLEVAESKQVRVKAYKTGYLESDTLTLNYIIIGGNSMLGLPTVLILFKTALSQAIEQGETGVLAVILKDASVTAGVKEYKMTISTDIPSALSDDNKKALQLAFEGKPKMVKAVIIPATATDYTAGLEYLEAIEFNVMTIPYIETADVNAVKLWAIGVYENKSTKIIAVLPKSAADHPAVVNWTQDDIVSSTYSDTDMDANESIAGIAGLIAGLPLTIAPTYQMPTWIDDAPKMTEAQANTRVGAGELFIYSKQGKNKVARGVTSLITPTTTYPEQFKKIKLVRIYNKIYTDLKSTIEDYYIGKVQNSYDNIVQLINVINGYFELLEQVPILEARQNSCEIDVASKKAYLESVGVDTSKLTEQQIKEYNAGDKVFLKCTISALDSMETFNIIINI